MSKLDEMRTLGFRARIAPAPDVANSVANAKAAMANTAEPVDTIFLHPSEMYLAKEFPGHEVVEVKPITYRYRDPERRRVYQRDLMRKKRALKKS